MVIVMVKKSNSNNCFGMEQIWDGDKGDECCIIIIIAINIVVVV